MDRTTTRELGSIPNRADDAHKGDVGRIAIVGGSCGETVMVGAVSLAANAAFRSGAGLVQMLVPEPSRMAVAVLAPCATVRTLPTTVPDMLEALAEFRADVVAIGPGLGASLSPKVVGSIIEEFDGPMVIDADGLNLLAKAGSVDRSKCERLVLTPHVGEMRRLLAARDIQTPIGPDAASRNEAASMLVDHYGGVAVLKGQGTVVCNNERVYTNETGNAGMATGGAGDVLTGVIAALIGQQMEPFEAAILGVYLHGLAGDFAAGELGRCSTTASDIIEYLPEAFSDHELGTSH